MSGERDVSPHHDSSIPGAPSAEKGRPRKSGSEQRQKQERFNFRVSPEERSTIRAAADIAGLTPSSYIRRSVLGSAQSYRRRRPSVEVQAVTRLQAEMNRIGGNLHQLLKRVNFGETPMVNELRSALTGYRDVIAAIMTTLGRGTS